MLYKVTHCAGYISVNTRPHQLHWGDQEMGTAISCIECSQIAGLIQKVIENLHAHANCPTIGIQNCFLNFNLLCLWTHT